MMNLSDAEVVVTTQKEIDDDTNIRDWFRLSDYGDTGEFYNACYSCFPNEKNPTFRYPVWENIPDSLIDKEWFSPNFFEVRDALERLNESEIEYFISWCSHHGYNIATDDAHLLVEHFQESHTPYPEFENDTVEAIEDMHIYQSLTSNFSDVKQYAFDVFDDSYD